MVVRLAHVCIETGNLAATEEFYGYLDINRRFEFRNKQGELVGVYLSLGNDTYIEIIKVKKPGKEGRIRHFSIEVENLDATRELLASKGVEVTEKMMGVDNTLLISCRDPDGNFIEFQQYTDKSLQKQGGVCEVDYVPA